jgi:hypothetical protein
VVGFTNRPLYFRGNSPRYPLDRRLGGPQHRSKRHGEENILDSTGTRTPTPRLSSFRVKAKITGFTETLAITNMTIRCANLKGNLNSTVAETSNLGAIRQYVYLGDTLKRAPQGFLQRFRREVWKVWWKRWIVDYDSNVWTMNTSAWNDIRHKFFCSLTYYSEPWPESAVAVAAETECFIRTNVTAQLWCPLSGMDQIGQIGLK